MKESKLHFYILACQKSYTSHASCEFKLRKVKYITNILNHAGRVSEDDVINLGSVVSGVVDRITPKGVVVYVNGKKYLKGTITTEHLADHQGICYFPGMSFSLCHSCCGVYLLYPFFLMQAKLPC